MPEDDDIRDESGLNSAERRILQAKADKADELQARVEQMERQGAIRDAGLELSPKQLKALEAVHEGEWNAEAIKASAAELGIIEAAPPPPPPPSVPADELDGQRRMTNAASGADNAPPNPEAEFDARMAALKADVAAGRKSPEQASGEFDQMYRSQYPDRVAIH